MPFFPATTGLISSIRSWNNTFGTTFYFASNYWFDFFHHVLKQIRHTFRGIFKCKTIRFHPYVRDMIVQNFQSVEILSLFHFWKSNLSETAALMLYSIKISKEILGFGKERSTWKSLILIFESESWQSECSRKSSKITFQPNLRIRVSP